MADTVSPWVLRELPLRNRDVLSRCLSVDGLVAELNAQVLPAAPGPETLSPDAARAKVVEIGLIGASIARHRQEANLDLMRAPERSFDGLFATQAGVPFLEYMRRLADRTATGHPPRDAYASLVRWNAPRVTVQWQGTALACLPSAFGDGQTRSYTADPGEHLFLTLLKKAEALEHAANALLHPIVAGDHAVDAPDTLAAVGLATVLLHAVHQVNLQFIDTDPAGEPVFRSGHFLDILRQFAIHWRVGDVPPSGAQDPEFLKRDFYLGLDYPDYARHVRRVFPALLDNEREELEVAMQLQSLPARLAQRIGIDLERLADGSPDGLMSLAQDHPWLVDYYLLMRANGWVAASHLMLTKRFLFKPMRERDRAGIPDSPLVSNRAGTTGMLEMLLESLAKPRLHHRLRGFARLPLDELLVLSPSARGELPDRDELLAMACVEDQAVWAGPRSEGQLNRSAQSSKVVSSMSG